MFFKRPQLTEPNVAPDWINSGEWRTWEAPLNVVRGEAMRQDAIASLCGPVNEHGYLQPVVVTLSREPNNPVDRQAIRAEVAGMHVGYMAQEFAGSMSPGLDKAKCRSFVVAGVIRGGAVEARSFGVHLWLGRRRSLGPSITIDEDIRNHPDFYVTWQLDYKPRRPSPGPSAGNEVEGIRTGASRHGGRWTSLEMLADSLAVIMEARKFLASEQDPLERHYAFTVLEETLYKSRNAFPSALIDFEAVCEQHDREMATIKPALMGFLGGVPFLASYKQMAIMKTKAKEHEAALDWCRRGISIYGQEAIETEGTSDLAGRMERLAAKLKK